jgi:hypothetical protein
LMNNGSEGGVKKGGWPAGLPHFGLEACRQPAAFTR